MAERSSEPTLRRGSLILLGLVLSFCLLASCGRAPAQQEERSEKPPRPLAFQPEEGRLVGVEWADVSSPADRAQRAPAVRRGALEAIDNPEERRTIGQLRADAVVALMDGNPDGAIARLSRAAEMAPDNAVVLSDLAAARLQRGKAFSDPYDFVLALSAAHRAVQRDPDLLAAVYNRALALQRLSLDLRARDEWQRYQSRETDRSWWNAAQEHATALTHSAAGPTPEESQETVRKAVERGDQQEVREIVTRSPRVLREHGEDLLGTWAEAAEQGREAEAQKLLATVRAIGSALAATNGEQMVADTVDQIDTLQATAPQRLIRLAQGLQTYKQGLILGEQGGNFEQALPQLEMAHRLLAEERSPFAAWATFRIAICHYQHAEYDEALTLLRPLFQEPYRSRYAALHGRAHWLEGLIAIIRGDPSAALTAYETALADFQKLGERSHAARMAGQVATTLDVLGRRTDAWRHLQPALIEPSTHESAFSRRSLCIAASLLAEEEGEAEIALWFQEEVVRNALAGGVTYPAVGALLRSSEILAALGRNKEAAQEVERARRRLVEIPDPGIRAVFDGDLRLVEARLARSPQEALSFLDGAIRTFQASSYHLRLSRSFFERARSHETLGDSAAAERDLAAAIDELELQRERIDDPEARISYFDRAREVLDAMLLLQLEERGQPEVAFRYSEQAKSRALLDWVVAHPFEQSLPENLRATGTALPDPVSLQSELPANTVVVEFAVLPRQLVIWIVRRDAFHVETVAISAKDLESQVRRLSRELSLERKANALREASQLQSLLIRPIEKYLALDDRIVVIPDGVLHALPFAVLYDARTRRHLIQDHVWSVAPSARLLIASLRRDEGLAGRRDPRALVVVDPDFDQEIFPTLDRLKAARSEASAVAFFPGSRVLSDRGATREAFLQNAGDYEVIHFGGHSLVNSSFPLLSQMLFATDPNDPARGILYSGDLLGRSFERTRLAVLASCSTAVGRISRTEGVQSLARPFLAAGVPTVIASLWDVDDTKTAELFGRFYRHLQEVFDPATALQQAQIESIAQGGAEAADPWAWGAFEVIGGSSPSP